MSNNEPTHTTISKTSYTFKEAVQYLKAKDNRQNEVIRWRYVGSGECVCIGINS